MVFGFSFFRCFLAIKINKLIYFIGYIIFMIVNYIDEFVNDKDKEKNWVMYFFSLFPRFFLRQ